ncbi:aspartate kinase [Carboxydochorda subterranea]|uniref:Aspartokinase n=1 Tax=Carboxydichorda subterranea TaxID=3109565 RepID=A0ABZ1C1B5_9FIRM|nr:aspartate kinase [Limnochorda sp. L945t]WRP18546.1 aspartate kinase [Limnochorda sp. L945t]
MGLLVQKFGGTSVATPERIRHVARRIADRYHGGHRVIVVVSAMGHTTDQLIELARQVTAQPPRRELDMLLSTGEQVSIALVAMALQDMGVPAISLTGSQVGIQTDGVFTRARIRRISTARLHQELDAGRVVVVAGFQGVTESMDITTLGRGGSDTTAVALAAAIQADECEIYTDVDGVYTADPRVVPSARLLPVISYGEMLEMASLGAVVLQPRSVELAAQYGVVIHVRSSFHDREGTRVVAEANLEKAMVVTGVTHDRNVAKIVIIDVPDRPGVAHRLFSELAALGINVDMIVQTAKQQHTTDLLFTVARTDLDQTLAIVRRVASELGTDDVRHDATVGKVSIVGAGMVSNPGVAARMFGALAAEGINIQAISTSEIKVSCLIDEQHLDRAVRAVHDAFGLGAHEAESEAVEASQA